jgi:dTDP-4-dehydrorhamnose reductase
VERLLVVGVDGALGMNLALALVDRFDVLGLYDRHPVQPADFPTARFEAAHASTLCERVRQWRPRWILHCGSLARAAWDPPVDECQAQAELQVAGSLVELSGEVAARLTVISSDAVFSGPRMFHDESSQPGNPSRQAAQVRALERMLTPTRALVVRTHAYGWSPVEAQAGFAELAFHSISEGMNVVADGRRHATPILATDLARLLLRAYELRMEGLYHLAGAERASPFRFLCELATAFGMAVPQARREPPAADADTDDETSLSSKRARRELEMTTPMLRDGLARFAEQYHDGWRDRFASLRRGGVACQMAA